MTAIPGKLAFAALALALGFLAWRAADALRVAAGALGAWLSLDYGEGIVLQQALMLFGPSAYGDITRYPFIVFHYPPGYLLAVRAAMALGLDVALAGRVVSLLATLAAAGAVAAMVAVALAPVSRAARIMGALAGALAVFAFSPVSTWMPLARVDMLSLALTVWGLVLAVQAPQASWRAYAAAALFTAAVFTRQTTIAAPVAATLVLLLASPRDALRLVGAGLAFSAAALGVATWLTGGGFLGHIVGHNINRYELKGFWPLYHFGVEHAPLIGLGALGALGVGLRFLRRPGRLRALLAAEPPARAALGAFLYVGLSTPLLALVAKSGSNVNYFLEWIIGCAMMVGLLAGGLAAQAARWPAALAAVVLAAALGAQVARLGPPAYATLPYPQSSEGFARSVVAHARSDARTIISDDMLITLRAGHQVPWEPAIFAELASLGRWDEQRITERIRRGDFAFAITQGDRGEWQFSARYNPAVADALDEAFPRKVRRGQLVIRLPAESNWTPSP